MTETPLRIVVADDEDDVRLLLSLQLARHGCVIVGESIDGAGAAKLCQEQEVDAVVLDLLMPGVSGFEAIPRLREASPGVAIVAYTAVAGDFVRDEMARLDVPLVLKSGDSQVLYETLRRTVEAMRRRN